MVSIPWLLCYVLYGRRVWFGYGRVDVRAVEVVTCDKIFLVERRCPMSQSVVVRRSAPVVTVGIVRYWDGL